MSLPVPKSPRDIAGAEYDWLAIDGIGNVALFSTAGGGYAPARFLADTDAHDTAIDAILASPTSTTALFAPVLGPNVKNTWRMMAERGIFAYDASPNGGAYRLVAAPAAPVHALALPSTAAPVASLVRLRTLQFTECPSITGEMISDHEP